MHEKNVRVIHEPDEAFAKLFPTQNSQPGVLYTPSQFTLQFEYCGKPYVFNTLTRQLLQMCLPIQAKAGEDYDELIGRRFLVPVDTDEFSFYKSVISILTVYRRKKHYQTYTILPTLGCNARCVYCFQNGMKQVGMTAETVEATLRFILSDCRGRKITLSWFGGEPLIRQDVIDQICRGVRDAGVEYKSLMVSNGSLITPEVVKKMIDLWHLRRIQISMDGEEQDYISRKRYLHYHDDYHSVINAVNLMSKAGITVMVRCNADEDNIDGIPRFIDDLSGRIEDKKNVSVYLTPLYQVMQGEHDLEIWPKLLSMRDVIKSAKFDVTFERFNDTLPWYHCMADADGIVIAPDGNLHCCEDLPNGSLIGNVYDGIIDNSYREAFISLDALREKCKRCTFLPDCKPIHSCPKFETHCREARELLALDALRSMIDSMGETKITED